MTLMCYMSLFSLLYGYVCITLRPHKVFTWKVGNDKRNFGGNILYVYMNM